MKQFSEEELEIARKLNRGLMERNADEAVKQLVLFMQMNGLKASARLVAFIPMGHRGDKKG